MRAYEIEDRVFARRRTPLSMQEARDLAGKLFAHFGVEPILVQRNRRGGRGATYRGRIPDYLGLPGRAPRIDLCNEAADWLVCHEVAHHVAASRGLVRRESGSRTWHGPVWAAIYVEAVRVGITESYADRLAAAFARGGLG